MLWVSILMIYAIVPFAAADAARMQGAPVCTLWRRQSNLEKGRKKKKKNPTTTPTTRALKPLRFTTVDRVVLPNHDP